MDAMRTMLEYPVPNAAPTSVQVIAPKAAPIS